MVWWKDGFRAVTFRHEGHLGREREIKVPKDPGFQTWLMRGGTEQSEFLPRCWQEELGRGGDKRVHATHAEKGKTQKLVWSVKSNVTKSTSSPNGKRATSQPSSRGVQGA